MNNIRQNCRFSEICRGNAIPSVEKFTGKQLRRNFVLHFTSYLSIALSNILPHSKIIKIAKTLLIFGKNNTRRLSNFLQTHIF